VDVWLMPWLIHPYDSNNSSFDLFFQDPEAMVIDHINYAVTDVDGDHTLIAGDDLIQSDVILGSKKIEVSLDAKFSVQPLGLDMLTIVRPMLRLNLGRQSCSEFIN